MKTMKIEATKGRMPRLAGLVSLLLESLRGAGRPRAWHSANEGSARAAPSSYGRGPRRDRGAPSPMDAGVTGGMALPGWNGDRGRR
jgi:hypothetical protein